MDMSTTQKQIDDLIQWFDDETNDAQVKLKEAKENGRKVVGVYCAYMPCELAWASGAMAVSLCAGTEDKIPVAEETLPRSFCPLIKASYGLAVTDSCPFFFFSDCVLGETTCDGKKKVFELLDDLKPIHVMQLPYRPGDPDARENWLKQIYQAKEFIEKHVGAEITEDSVKAEIKRTNNLYKLLREVVTVFHGDCIPVTWTQMLTVLNARGFIVNRDAYNEKLSELITVLKTAVSEGISIYPKEAPRILITGTPLMPTTDKVMRITEDAGAAVVCHDACSGIKMFNRHINEDKEPYEALAEFTLSTPCACMSPNHGRFDLLRQAVNDYRIDGVIDMVWLGCHTFNVESALVQRVTRDELELAYLKLETDYSQSDTGQLQLRIEAFLETIC